jgi:hypothetical protein
MFPSAASRRAPHWTKVPFLPGAASVTVANG